MMVALLVLAFASLVFWLVFFQFKLIRLTPGWGVIFGFFVVHLMLVFVIGLRFVTPNSANATVVQRTIQLIPRLPEPTLVEEVLVEEGASVKKGQPLFQFDRRPYQYKVDQISAQLAAAKQNVKVLKADVEAAAQGAKKAKVELEYAQYQKRIFDKLAQEQAVREEDIEQWLTRVNAATATNDAALAQLERASLQYKSEIDGVNTTVANMEAQLQLARYYLDNTTLTRAGGRSYHQPSGPPGNGGRHISGRRHRRLYRGCRPLSARNIFPGEPQICEAGSAGRSCTRPLSRSNLPWDCGQHLARQWHRTIFAKRRHSEIPGSAPNVPQGQYAVKIRMDHADQSKFPIGAQGLAAIYTGGEHGAWAVLRKISIRAHSWFNWVYPLDI